MCTLHGTIRMSETVGVRFKKEVLEALKNFMLEKDLSRTEAVNLLLTQALIPKRHRGNDNMYQTRESGAKAARFGHDAAKKLAAKLGATKVSKTGNEFELDGRRICIKTARKKTSSVGVTYKMLERLDGVIGAFEDETNTFHLYEISPDKFSREMRETRSKGPSKGRVGLVSKRIFETEGEKVGILPIA